MKCPTSRVIPWTVEAHAGAEWAAPAGDTGPDPREAQVSRLFIVPTSCLPAGPRSAVPYARAVMGNCLALLAPSRDRGPEMRAWARLAAGDLARATQHRRPTDGMHLEAVAAGSDHDGELTRDRRVPARACAACACEGGHGLAQFANRTGAGWGIPAGGLALRAQASRCSVCALRSP